MSLKTQLVESFAEANTHHDISGFLKWVKPSRGMSPKLAAALILNIGADDFEEQLQISDGSSIKGFEYYNETLDFYEANRKKIQKWILSEAESLSNVYPSSIAMIASLPLLESNDATHDEVAQLMWRSKADNIADDGGLYGVYAHAVCDLISKRVIGHYQDYIHEKEQD